MKSWFLQTFIPWIPASVLVGFCLTSFAQPAGLLYDPEPPADSAYVRAIHASSDGDIDVLVDGRIRVKKLAAGDASHYMVLSAGRHIVAVHSPGKSVALLTMSLEVVRGRAMTVAFTSLKADAAPILFEDKTNSNKLKALLTFYHLEPKTKSLDVFTSDGATKVFDGLAYGMSASIQVNPIAIDLMAVKSGDKESLTKIALVMNQGGTYSVLLLPGMRGKLNAHAFLNKTERFAGN